MNDWDPFLKSSDHPAVVFGRQKTIHFWTLFWSSETSSQPQLPTPTLQGLKVPCCTSLFPCTRCTANMASKGFSVARTASTKSCWLCTRRALNQVHLAQLEGEELELGDGPCRRIQLQTPENSYETQRIAGLGPGFSFFKGLSSGFHVSFWWGWKKKVYIVHTQKNHGPNITSKKKPMDFL